MHQLRIIVSVLCSDASHEELASESGTLRVSCKDGLVFLNRAMEEDALAGLLDVGDYVTDFKLHAVAVDGTDAIRQTRRCRSMRQSIDFARPSIDFARRHYRMIRHYASGVLHRCPPAAGCRTAVLRGAFGLAATACFRLSDVRQQWLFSGFPAYVGIRIAGVLENSAAPLRTQVAAQEGPRVHVVRVAAFLAPVGLHRHEGMQLRNVRHDIPPKAGNDLTVNHVVAKQDDGDVVEKTPFAEAHHVPAV